MRSLEGLPFSYHDHNDHDHDDHDHEDAQEYDDDYDDM